MFLHLSVILSTGGGVLCMMPLPVWLPGPMFLVGGSLSRAVSLQRPPPRIRKVGGEHPTGMLSCFKIKVVKNAGISVLAIQKTFGHVNEQKIRVSAHWLCESGLSCQFLFQPIWKRKKCITDEKFNATLPNFNTCYPLFEATDYPLSTRRRTLKFCIKSRKYVPPKCHLCTCIIYLWNDAEKSFNFSHKRGENLKKNSSERPD